ncbi:DUF3311 domain-containing protein [Natronolimnobius sp. AArcel1]|uniref:DUF3311 domain-containing protein n=1 Tax=Natronolimnobius sp. AArcel1 TaxID=1679093 RepID=UPI0013ECBFBA|nr:DUF3311 domain-containing protein [Natronolimnobius sp. AArcel1]NGM68050.1 DUF3311 domain-containing protein [Natronolimnobius sp. AArcel1]
MRRLEIGGWIVVGVVLCALSIPWFLWGNATTIAGIPLWLWWHIGWMLLASVVFWYFAQTAWGIGIEPESEGDSSERPDRPQNEYAGGDTR